MWKCLTLPMWLWWHICFSCYPSIHYLCHCSFLRGTGGTGANPSWHWARGAVHCGLVASQHTDIQPFTITFTLIFNLLSPITLNPICMFLDYGWKLEYKEKIHINTWKTCKLHTTTFGTWNHWVKRSVMKKDQLGNGDKEAITLRLHHLST